MDLIPGCYPGLLSGQPSGLRERHPISRASISKRHSRGRAKGPFRYGFPSRNLIEISLNWISMVKPLCIWRAITPPLITAFGLSLSNNFKLALRSSKMP